MLIVFLPTDHFYDGRKTSPTVNTAYPPFCGYTFKGIKTRIYTVFHPKARPERAEPWASGAAAMVKWTAVPNGE